MTTDRGPDVPAGFRAVDQAADPDWFATYVDQFTALPGTEPYKRQAVARRWWFHRPRHIAALVRRQLCGGQRPR